MKKLLLISFMIMLLYKTSYTQTSEPNYPYEVIRINSHIKNLKIGVLHKDPNTITGRTPVLFIHGSSFPSALASGFRMKGGSWIDNLSSHNYDCFAMDFLGYGYSDRYPEMIKKNYKGNPPGQAEDVYKDIDSAITYILKQTGSSKVNIIAHSWGGSVAALYATKFPDKIENLILLAPLTAGNSNKRAQKINYAYESLTPEARVKAMQDLVPLEANEQRLEPEIYSNWKVEWAHSDPYSKINNGEVHFPSGPSQDIDDMKTGKSFYNPSLIKVPTFIIRGEWDSSITNADAQNLFNKLINAPVRKYIVIEKSTHVLHLEQNRNQLYLQVLNILNKSNMSQNNHSIAVIFEVIPEDNKKQEYLNIAAQLKVKLEKIDGFISIERFQSLTHPEKILSLSFWRDETAIEHWRNLEMHRNAQDKGRKYIFKDYHLRIASVIRDYGMFDRDEAPKDSRNFHSSSNN